MTPPVVLPGSSINKRADELGPADPSMQYMAARLVNFGGGGAPPGRLALSMKAYSTPIYQYETRSQSSYFFPMAFSQNAGSAGTLKPGTLVPDNPSRWIPGTGNDNIFLVERRSTGEVWDFWMARQPGYNAITLTNLLAGLAWKTPQHICASASYSNTIFKTAQTHVRRGMGINKRALITTGEEVQAAIEENYPISHAMEITIANTWYTNLKTAVQGVDYLPPATRCEWDEQAAKNRPGYDPDKTHLSLSGLRVALRLTAAERSAWLDLRVGQSGLFREFCRVVLDAICDYGLVVGETGGFGMRSEFDGVLGPARPIYKKYGWDVDKPEAQEYCFEKLLVDHADRVYVVRPSF